MVHLKYHRPSHHHHHHHHHQQSAEALEELHHHLRAHLASYYCYYIHSHKRWTSAFLRLLLLLSLVCFSLILVPRIYLSVPPAADEEPKSLGSQEEKPTAPCSSMANGTICCDRTAFRTDVCYMRGDVRTHSGSNSILLVSAAAADSSPLEEKIRPYTRKWETSVMSTVDDLRLRTVAPDHDSARGCDVRHDVPAVVFSTGGYTGNLYHEFNDGIIPLYITSHHLNRKVAFVILEYHDWWAAKYREVLSRLSDYPLIDFARDPRTHCFPEVVVGLRIHDELSVDSTQMANNETIGDFRRMLDDAYGARISWQRRAEREDVHQKTAPSDKTRPNIVVLSRNGSRSIKNERQMVKLAKDVGFEVQVLRPSSRTELSRMYQVLNSCDAMLGVHGAAMTHLLFMRPGAVLVQIVPLGTDWAAESYYGEPALKMGLRYMAYKILPRESSLIDKYEEVDPVLMDPDSVNSKGWQFTKKVYLEGQTVRLDLARFREHLVGAHRYLMASRRKKKAMELRSRRLQLHAAAKAAAKGHEEFRWRTDSKVSIYGAQL